MTAQRLDIIEMPKERGYLAFGPSVKMARAGLVEVDWDDETLARDIFTTSCWRRYIATWAIVERKVYLKAIVGRYKLVSEEMLFAYWYTGKIVLYPHSRMSYSRSEVIFASTYRPVLVVDRGVVT